MKPGRVIVVSSASHSAHEYEPHVVPHPSWSDLDTRFFNALSPDAAAEFAGVPVNAFPTIEVMEASSVIADFEAMELERCGRRVFFELDGAHSSPRLRQLRTTLWGHLGPSSPSDKSLDRLADILTEPSTAVRRIDKNALKQFTPDHIDDFVSRWNSRPIEMLNIGSSPSFKP